MVSSQQTQVSAFLADLKSLTSGGNNRHRLQLVDSTTTLALPDSKALVDQWAELQKTIVEQEKHVTEEMTDLKRLIAAQNGYKMEGDGHTVVYVGPELVSMLDRTERNLEWKMKINSVATVASLYALFAITFPILCSFFGGNG